LNGFGWGEAKGMAYEVRTFNSIEWIPTGAGRWYTMSEEVLSIPLNGFLKRRRRWGRLWRLCLSIPLNGFIMEVRGSDPRTVEKLSIPLNGFVLKPNHSFHLTIIGSFQFHWMDSATSSTVAGAIPMDVSFNSIEWILTPQYKCSSKA